MSPRRSPRLAAALVAVALALAFIGLAQEAHEREIFAIDHTVHDAVQGWRQPALEAPMRALSHVGSGAVLIPLNLALAVVLWLRGDRRALLVPLGGAAGVVIEALAKWIVDRPRPKNVGYGFPSGHVMGVVVFFGLLIAMVWEIRLHPGWACLATTGAVALVAGVAFSRLYLDAHWLSDVLGAAAAGGALVIALRLHPGAWPGAPRRQPGPGRA
jgi:undecaprenyl-diphosphatase